MPLLPPKEPTREGKLFRDIRWAVPKLHERERHRNAWISDKTWRLADERVSARRGTRVWERLRKIGRSVRAILKRDRIPEVNVKPSEIDDSVPTEDEIAEAVTKLRRNRSGGPSRIRAEHL